MMVSSPGHPGRSNEDFVGAVPGAVVLLDGAGIVGSEAICHHGVAWYSHTLGATLLDRLSRHASIDLAGALADSIDQVANRHRGTCDIANPSSPQSTVAIVRVDGDRAEHLVLADSFVVLDSPGAEPQVVTDVREVNVRRECTSQLRGLPYDSPEHVRATESAIEALRARRNQPGGYWIAKDDPQAAVQAVTGCVTLDGLAGIALLSNGASRAATTYGLANWHNVLKLMRTNGPAEILRQVRAAELAVHGTESIPELSQPDDATAAYWELEGSERGRDPSGQFQNGSAVP